MVKSPRQDSKHPWLRHGNPGAHPPKIFGSTAACPKSRKRSHSTRNQVWSTWTFWVFKDLNIICKYISIYIYTYILRILSKAPLKNPKTKVRFDAAKFRALLINTTGTCVVIEVFAPAILLHRNKNEPGSDFAWGHWCVRNFQVNFWLLKSVLG